MRSIRLALIALGCLLPVAARAQVGGATDIIIGKVIGPDSQPVAGAKVLIVSASTNAQRSILTRDDGRFTVLFRDGGGTYRLLVTMLGFRPANLTIARQADEDRLVVTVRMSSNPAVLSTVTVRGRASAAPAQASNAGGSERNLPTVLLERLPMNPGDLIATATLAPGVVAVGSTDSTRASFSVAAQPASQNNISVDGMSFLFGSVPQDAVRATRVVLNAYDVSRGQFAGGQIATTTKSGTSSFQGTANYTGRSHITQFAGNENDAFAQKYGQLLLSTGLGGPIRKKKEGAYYFVAGDIERRDDDTFSLLTLGPGTMTRLGLAPESLSTFLTQTNAYQPAVTGSKGANRVSTTGSALARLDFDVSDVHQLMLRGDFRKSQQDTTRVSPLAMPSTAGTVSSSGGGGMAMLTSVFGSFINEARIYGSAEQQDALPYTAAPSGVVNVQSAINGKQQLTQLQFGGNGALPRATHNTLQEASNELSWLTEDGAHRLKLGVLANRDRTEISGVNNRYGVFVYNSLADFQTNTPSVFARTLSGTDRNTGSDNGAVYLGDAWRKSQSLQFVYGARLEGSHFPGAPAENPAVFSAFGRHTSSFPNEVHVSPRVGVTYLIGNVAGVPTGNIRAGFGEFRGRVPSQLVGYVAQNNGLAGGQTQLVCVGPAVPTPVWPSYFGNPATIPTTCSGTGGPTLGSSAPNVAVFDDKFGAPRVWRASFAFGKRVFTTYGIGIDAMYALGQNNPGATDLNLVSAPAFTLSDGRPVYSQKAAIVPASGATAIAASRTNTAFGTAFALGSNVHSRTTQITTQLTGGGKALGSMTIAFFSVAYTFMRATDETNGYPFANSFATTAGDPRKIEWGTSDLERRHNVIATSLLIFPHSLELSLIARALSGTRYTPMVNGDINGDGIRNDRAKIPDPNSVTLAQYLSDPVMLAMTRVLNNADRRSRSCLFREIGKIASRNQCTTPWMPGLDLQVNWRPAGAKLDRRVTFSLVAQNTLAGADQLLHGSSKMKGWGQPVFPDRFLLNVTGFDAATNSFRYSVNEHFGSPSGASNPFRLPFQLGLQVHAQLGTDPQREALKSVFGTADGKPPSVADLKKRIATNFPLPVKMTLAAADTLHLDLTDAQLVRLKALNDSMNTAADTIVGSIAQILSKAGPNPDPGSIAPKLQRLQTQALNVIQQSAVQLKAVLTPEQWAKLPDRIRFPLGAPAPATQGRRPPG